MKVNPLNLQVSKIILFQVSILAKVPVNRHISLGQLHMGNRSVGNAVKQITRRHSPIGLLSYRVRSHLIRIIRLVYLNGGVSIACLVRLHQPSA